MKTTFTLLCFVGIVILASGCVGYGSLYKYAHNGTVSHPHGLKFDYPAEWTLGKIESPYIMSLYESEDAVPGMTIVLANRHPGGSGYINNTEDLKDMLGSMETEHSFQKSIEIKNIAGRDWGLRQTENKNNSKMNYYFVTLCQDFMFGIIYHTNSTEGDPSTLYPIAESLEC